MAASYGAAGSLIIILVWVFYSAQILFFGAAFTRVYAMRYGSHRAVNQLTAGAAATRSDSPA
jgi:membrane protein